MVDFNPQNPTRLLAAMDFATVALVMSLGFLIVSLGFLVASALIWGEARAYLRRLKRGPFVNRDANGRPFKERF